MSTRRITCAPNVSRVPPLPFILTQTRAGSNTSYENFEPYTRATGAGTASAFSPYSTRARLVAMAATLRSRARTMSLPALLPAFKPPHVDTTPVYPHFPSPPPAGSIPPSPSTAAHWPGGHAQMRFPRPGPGWSCLVTRELDGVWRAQYNDILNLRGDDVRDAWWGWDTVTRTSTNFS